MHSFMCCFYKLVYRVHYKAENENTQNKLARERAHTHQCAASRETQDEERYGQFWELSEPGVVWNFW